MLLCRYFLLNMVDIPASVGLPVRLFHFAQEPSTPPKSTPPKTHEYPFKNDGTGRPFSAIPFESWWPNFRSFSVR